MATSGLTRRATQRKAVAVVQALVNFVFGGLCVSWIDVSEAGEGARVGGLIFVVDLIGDCIDRVDLDTVMASSRMLRS